MPVSAAVYATSTIFISVTPRLLNFGLVDSGSRTWALETVYKSFGQPVIPSCSKPGMEWVSPANIILYTECYSRALGACHSDVLTNLRSVTSNPIALKPDRTWISLSVAIRMDGFSFYSEYVKSVFIVEKDFTSNCDVTYYVKRRTKVILSYIYRQKCKIILR